MKYYYSALLSFLAFAPARAQVSIDFPTDFAGFSTQDIKMSASNIVRIIVGFIGIILIAGIIFGGVKMMISRGDPDKVGDGQKILTGSALGLIILLAAYAIASFVIASLNQAI